MSGEHEADRNSTTFRRVTNSRWFPLLFSVAVLGVILYLNSLASRTRAASPRPSFPRTKWEKFVWPEAGLQVVMPENPQSFHELKTILGEACDVIGYHSSSEYTTYSAAYVEYPSDLPLPQNDEELMAQASNWLGVHAINDDASIQKVACQGHDGLEVSRIARTSNGSLVRSRVRLFLMERLRLIIGATGDKDGFDEKGAKEFLGSLRFKASPASP